MSRSWTFLLRTFRQLGMVYTHCWLLAPPLWNSSLTWAQPFSPRGYWHSTTSWSNAFFDYNFNSRGPTLRLIDGNQGIWWVCWYIANGREHELPWCDPSSSRDLIVHFLIYWVKPCHVTVSKVYGNSCIKLQLILFVKNKTLLRQGVCVWHICIDVKLLILFLIWLGFAKLDVWCCTYHCWTLLDSSKKKPCLGRVCVCDTSE